MVFRLEPQGRVQDYKTYQITQPRTAKTLIATCQGAGCERYEFGWLTRVPSLGAQADYIRNRSGRRFQESVQDGISTFTFYPGQQCFEQHHVADRPQEFSVRDGDHRGNPTRRRRVHSAGKFWVEDFQENQERVIARLEKG